MMQQRTIISKRLKIDAQSLARTGNPENQAKKRHQAKGMLGRREAKEK